MAVFINKHEPFDLALISYVLYTMLCNGFYFAFANAIFTASPVNTEATNHFCILNQIGFFENQLAILAADMTIKKLTEKLITICIIPS